MAFTDRLHNRGSISTGYDIDHSLKVENDNREYIRWTNFSNQGSEARKKKFSMSLWCKRTELGRQQIIWSTSQNGYLGFDAGDTVVWYQQYVGSGTQIGLRTTSVFRDTSAWYHFMIVVDTAQSTEANRVKMYVNGVQETVFGTPQTYPSQNAQASNLYEQHLILGEWGGGSTGFSGYISDYYFLSEIAASPTDLGKYDEDTGIWKPKAYSGTISSPSHFLEFKDGSDLGTATSGLDGDYLENITAADQSTDTPTNNFCTYNNNFRTATTIAATEGQTKVTTASGAGWVSIVATFGLTSGKWYWEAASSGHYVFYGIADVESDVIPQATGGYFLGYGDDNSTKAIGMYGLNGQVYSDTAGHNGPGAAANTVVQIALDMDNRCVYFGANGSYISGADPTSGASKTNASQWNANWTDTVYPALSVYAGYHSTTNFGGYTTDVISSAATDANGYGTFEYAPPSGYYAICTKNLAEYG